MTEITKIVLTGGPCGGKTSAMSVLKERLAVHDVEVFEVREQATALIQCGKTPENMGSYAFHSLLFSNQLAEENGIRTVLNLSDSKTKLEKYLNKYIVGSYYYYKTLYKRGRVFTAGLSLTHKSPSYRHQVAAALRFMTKNKGPFLVHCEVGRDRTGLVILLLESLMGVPYGYMVNDYAQTYLNTTYDSPATAKQKAASHVNSELMYISGQKSITDWSKVNLNRYAVLYLKMGGMTDSEISLLRKNLSVSYPAREVTFESLIKK